MSFRSCVGALSRRSSEATGPASSSHEPVFHGRRPSHASRFVVLAAALVWSPLAQALPIEWAVVLGDWLDPASWSPPQVPTMADDVTINNGGTAEATTATELFAASLRVGVDGGEGTLTIDPPTLLPPLVLDGPVLIGVTTSGSEASTGSLSLGREVEASFFRSTTPSPFRLGATDAGGNAEGTLIARSGATAGGDFSSFEVGVSTAVGDAVGVLEGTGIFGNSDSFSVGNTSSVEIGVAKDSGGGTGSVRILELRSVGSLAVGLSTGSGAGRGDLFLERSLFDPVWRSVRVGVAGAEGPATGILSHIPSFDGDGTGDLEIGVALGSGRAHGSLVQMTGLFTQRTIEDFVDIRVGVSDAAGDATGYLLSLSGVRAENLIVGTNAGGGSGTGSVRLERGASRLTTMTLGPSSTLQTGLKGPIRGEAFNPGYATINVDTVTLDPAAALVAEFAFIPEVAQTFEIIESNSLTGIGGDFGSVEIRNLNQGYTASPGVVVDGGVEKYVIALSGAPVEPVWTNPATGAGAGDWFDPASWSSAQIPGSGDRTSISNGGEAVASSASGSDPIEVFFLSVGEDGGTGALSVEGLTVAPLKGLTIGKIDQDYLLGGTGTGAAVFTDVDYVPPQVYEVDEANAADDGTETGLGVGLAAGEGTAEGVLTLEGGSVILPGDLRTPETSQLIVGGAFALTGDGSPSAIGRLAVNPGGGQTTIRSDLLGIGRAIVEAGDSVSADAVASATLRNAEIGGLVRVATSRCSAPSSTATSTVTASSLLSSTITDRELDLGAADASERGCRAVANIESFDIVGSQLVGLQAGDLLATGPGGTVESTIDLSVTDSRIIATGALEANARRIDFGDIEAFGAGASATAVITADLTRVVGDTEGGELEVVAVQGADGSTVSSHVELDLVDSQLTVGPSKVGEVESFGGAGTNLAGRIDVSMSQGSALVGTDLLLGVAESSASGVADVEARLELTDSSVSFSGEVNVGRFLGTSTDDGNRASATLTSIRSLVTASTLRVAAINEPSNPLEGSVILDSSLLSAEQLDLGADGDLFLHLEGIERVTAGTIGAAGTYAAVDALDATLEGEIVAHFDFVPTPGTHIFDLVVSDSLTALDDTTATLTVAGLDPGFTVDFFGVVEDGTDVLRLIVSGSPSADLAISLNDSPDPVSPGAPSSYTLVASNLGPNPAASVTVSQSLPPEVAFQSAGGEGWACSEVGGIVTCTRPALVLGAAPP
ncbi:MAG: DUF11 domain-containing protein, partial [Holophagales bacterium]|nr:DUF11 domain-containing protein [Holophagales bacterium]